MSSSGFLYLKTCFLRFGLSFLCFGLSFLCFGLSFLQLIPSSLILNRSFFSQLREPDSPNGDESASYNLRTMD
jgi:hypothetical protein